MATGELLTRVTIWAAMLCYTLGAFWLFKLRFGEARMAWTFGCIAFIAHVALAFAVFHGWSHAAAVAETARQSEKVAGVRAGFGIYLNYLFGLAWVAIVARWWMVSAHAGAPGQRTRKFWNGFALFMIFNGAVVFGRGPVRWFGAVICAVVMIAWVRESRRALAEAGS